MFSQTRIVLLLSIVSSAVYLSVITYNLDYIFLFLSTIPLFIFGLSGFSYSILKIGIISVIPIIIGSDISYGILYISMFVLPCFYLCHTLLRHYDLKILNNDTVLRLWVPTGIGMLNLALYGCIVLSIMTAIFAYGDVSLPDFIEKTVQNELKLLAKGGDINLRISVGNMALMLSGFSVWMWAFLLLSGAWVVNWFLLRNDMAKRKNLAITTFSIPYWLLSLMGICALASIIGSRSMSFLGKSSLLILLLPYFCQGIAMFHDNIRNSPNRRFFMFIVYFPIVMFLWPALFVAAIGLVHHVKNFNKYLSSGRS
ncbi:MAG: hypothetical protein R3D71_05655 [Rickettsiales bacterium]